MVWPIPAGVIPIVRLECWWRSRTTTSTGECPYRESLKAMGDVDVTLEKMERRKKRAPLLRGDPEAGSLGQQN